MNPAMAMSWTRQARTTFSPAPFFMAVRVGVWEWQYEQPAFKPCLHSLMRSRPPFFQHTGWPRRVQYTQMGVSARPGLEDTSVMRPTIVEVRLARLTENYRAIRTAVAPAAVMPIVKANAYGHGLVDVARHLIGLGAPSLGVGLLEEAVALRDAGVTTPILVMGGILGNQVPLFLRHGLTLTASSIDKLRHVDEAARELGVTAKVHLKIDTGMERIGVHYYNAEGLLERASECRHCVVEGIYSHFANADAADLGSARLQLSRFHDVLQWYDKHGVKPPVR